jgi:alpha-mannosidase
VAQQTLTFVSHTHWDREWYQPFEEYRIRLVQLMDKLLHILDTDPEYRYFMLDGQTIVLDDYLAIRPQNEGKVQAYVASGRLLIGPWHILPDEFLVAPESTIRNLLVGAQTCARFGKRMDVGNIPDPFGHISQLPQILRGFDIDSAVFWRGVGDMANEFAWMAPDGTDILVIYQRDGYGNASHMPANEKAFVERTRQIIGRLSPTATTPHLLAMNGSDHVEPMPELPRLLAAADAALPEVDVRHGTLPQFIAALRAASPELETRCGEMRDPSRAPLLPGVLSTRMWIKQRNTACETLLTRWAEPLAGVAEIAGAPLALHGQSALVRQAWRYLLQNHPHDSICGCSIDQVHREMGVRFDWVEQIGEKVVAQCMESLAAIVDTNGGDSIAKDSETLPAAVVVFNPTTRPRTDRVEVQVLVPEDVETLLFVSSDGRAVRPRITRRERDVLGEMGLDVAQFRAVVEQVPTWEIDGQSVQELAPGVDGATLNLEVKVAKGLPPNRAHIERERAEIERVLEEGQVSSVHLLVHRGMLITCTFVARDVPGLGYRTYWVRPTAETPAQVDDGLATPAIENEFLGLEANEDGTLTLIDKTTGNVYAGLNRFVDVGDRGDEYNFCPVQEDVRVSTPDTKPLICLTERGPAGQTLEIVAKTRIPDGLGETRDQRSQEWVDLPITTRVSLIPGVCRVDIETTVENYAADHRLRVHFPVPAFVDSFDAEGHLDVVTRSLDLAVDTQEWAEQPAPTHPQRAWADVSDGKVGLMVANRGLPEVEVLRMEEGSEIALTLLRSVGWLSRGDLSVRRGHAGPGLPTPEAQCIGEYTFHYALIPHGGDWQGSADFRPFVEAHAFAAPLRAVSTYVHTGTLSAQGSFVEVAPENLVISAVKEAENGEGLIVRFWNASAEPCEGTIVLWKPFRCVARCNLGEREIEPLKADTDGIVHVSVRGREIVTLRMEFEQEIDEQAHSPFCQQQSRVAG